MVDQVKVDKPTSDVGDDVSKEYALQLLDLDNNSAVFIVRNLRISAVGIEAKVVGKIVRNDVEDMKPFTVYYNGKFVAEELIDE